MLRNALKLTTRGLLNVTGSEAEIFLHGLITKDISCIQISNVIYAFLLNAKGRIQSDFLIYKYKNLNGLFIETDLNRINSIEKTLTTYRLRRKVDIEICKKNHIYFTADIIENSESLCVYEDPRIPSFGFRIISQNQLKIENTIKESDYLRRRIEWGIVEGFQETGDQIPLQINGDYLNGISFEKGCYIGQELVARTHHTGVIRKRALPIRAINSSKISGKLLFDEKGKRQGKILTALDNQAIALITISNVNKTIYDETKNAIEVLTPVWWPQKLI